MRRPAIVALISGLLLAGNVLAGPGVTGPAAARAAVAEGIGPDFNGDGFADLAVGSPFEDVGSVADAGAVSVLYGSSSGVQAAAPDDQFWTQGSLPGGDPAEAGDLLGFALADGDFNGDGFGDMAAGAPSEDVESIADAGAVTVLYGSPAGLQADAPQSQLWTQDSSDVEDTSESGDQFGTALASGDFNGDGFADLAVGAPLEDAGTVVDAGAMAVLYGSAGGLQAAAPADAAFTQGTPEVLDFVETGDQFGSALGAGDFNADGFADLTVGVRYEDFGRRDSGVVQVLYGTAGGVQATSPNDQRWAQGSDDLQDSAEGNDRFGYSLAEGDFNGDGFADLLVGVPFEDVGSGPSVSNGGGVQILYGTASGIQATSPDDQLWTQDSPGVIGLAESPDQFGYSVAGGDYDGDGFDDLAAGVRSEDGGPERVPRSGAVNVLYGSATGIQPARDWHLDQDGPGVEDQIEPDDRLGSSVAIEDFNGDGFGDLATGVVLEEEGTRSASGGVHVLYGSTAGLQAFDPDDRLWSQDDPGMADPAEGGDQFGHSLSGPGSAR